MTEIVRYERDGALAHIHFDDGKANTLSPTSLEALHGALDRADADDPNVLVLQGRPGMFSAGFDLKVLPALPKAEQSAFLCRYQNLLMRLLGAPRVVVAVTNGHALAGGALLLLASDLRLGVRGPYKFGLTEVAVGIAMPDILFDIARERLGAQNVTVAALLAQVYDADGARAAGFLDEVLDPADGARIAHDRAVKLAELPATAFRVSKQRLRAPLLERLGAARLDQDIDVGIAGR